MADEYIKAKTATTVPLSDGSHRSLDTGEPIAVDQLSDSFQESLRGEGANAEWVSGLFEASSKEDADSWAAGVSTIQTDFDRDRLNKLANITLPGPDEQVVYDEPGAPKIEKAPPVLPSSVSAQSSAVTVEGPAADAALNEHVGNNDPPSPSPADEESEGGEQPVEPAKAKQEPVKAPEPSS